MKPRLAPARGGSTTLLDLMAIIAAVAVVAALVALPMLAERYAPASRTNCINNLKQVGLSFRLWAGDNNDKMPAQVSTNGGGTMELVSAGVVFPHFAVMSNELSTPKIIVCPDDRKRKWGTDFSALTDANVSYFIVPEADETVPQLWLAGDRNLAVNNVQLKPGLFVFKANKLVSWTTQMHNNKGNLCFADGSVWEVPNANMQRSATNALRSYFEATTNTSFRLAIP